jgi:hypothetical protein
MTVEEFIAKLTEETTVEDFKPTEL